MLLISQLYENIKKHLLHLDAFKKKKKKAVNQTEA